MSLRRLRALVAKEFRQIVRDPGVLGITLVLPVLLVLLFGYGVSLDSAVTRVGLVVEDPAYPARSLADGFRGSPQFEVVEGRDRRAFVDRLVDGRLRGVVVIPADFTRRLLAGSGAVVQVLVDGVEPNTARFVQHNAQGVVSAWQATAGGGAPPIRMEARFWFNPDLTGRVAIVPGAVTLVMTIVGTLLTSLVIAREWERGTLEALMATPVRPSELLLGKFIPYFVLGLIAMTVCVAVAQGLFGLPRQGSLWALYALSAAFLLPAMGLGLLISAVTRNQFLAAQAGMLAGFLPTFLLSGFVFEIDSMPLVIRWITVLVPARYMIPSLQSVFLVGDLWPLFSRAIVVLGGMGVIGLTLVALTGGKRLR